MTDNIVFSGSLLFLSLADVFQLLGGNNCTGKLTLRSKYASDMAVVYFVGGSPTNAYCGELKGLDAVYSLFGWTDGKYDFSEEDLTGIKPEFKKSMMEIVLDASRLLDDGKIDQVGPGPDEREDIETTGPDGMKTDLMQPIKGPPVDYLYVTGDYYYPDGTTIVKEGEFGKWLWAISDGTVKITRATSKGAITLARLGEGCFIGTLKSLLYGECERTATAVSEGDVQLCILDAEALHREYSKLSENFKKILLSLDKRLKPINDNAVQAYIGNPLKGLPEDKVFEDRFQNNEELYIIREGAADIIGKGPKGDVNLLSLGVDDVFGRIPFMAFGHEPLAASVMTSIPFEADILDSKALQLEYDNLSHMFRNFVFGTATNISMTTKLFYQLLGNT
ncbi:MAG: cyclic nucleotide-binding domain-containing protein [Deltaproteobacteria bacterium]